MSDTITTTNGWGDDWGRNWGGQSVVLEDPPEVAILGGEDGATLGGPYAAFMGPQSPPGYRIEIQTGSGDSLSLGRLQSLSVNRRHTAVSDWEATVPTRPGIEDYTLSQVRLHWGDTILFNGRFESVSGDLGAPTITVSGSGIETDLQRGEVTLDLANVPIIDAIRQTWRNYTSFDATVIAPEESDHPAMGRITTDSEDSEYSGTPIEVLKQLHEDGGMRFTVLHSRPGRYVESYPIGGRRRRHDWRVLGGSRDVSAEDYANVVIVRGEYRSDGTRLTATAEDDEEIAAMRERGVGDDGRVVYPIDDRTLSDPEKAKSQAKSKLMDLVDKDSVGGSLDIMPSVAAPGYTYYIPEFGGADPTVYGEGVYGEGTYGSTPGQYVTLNKINYSISRGEASCSLDFSRRDGFAATLSKAYGDSL